MTTTTLDTPTPTGTLEKLVDRLLASLFRAEPDHAEASTTLVKTVHEARRLRQTGDPGGALAALAGVDTADATDPQLRWLYAEWLDIARRRFAGCGAMLYSPGAGRATVLLPCDGDYATLEVAPVLGMCWPAGKLVSRRSLRGLKRLAKGGAAWS